MKRLLGLVCAVGITAGCGPEIDLAARQNFNYGNNFWTLFVYDGITGTPLENATVTLVVGTYEYELKNNGGYYSIGQIPYGEHVARIEAEGYLPFIGIPEFYGSDNANYPSFTTNTVLLFPSTTVQDPVLVHVYEDQQGTPVAGGKVIASMDDEGSLFSDLDNNLNGEYFLRPSVVVADIAADGTATLPASALIFGASYDINVLAATNADGAYLEPEDDYITVGYDFPELTIFMGPPALTPEALSTNTEGNDSWDYNNDFNYDGYFDSLIINFPYPMELCSSPEDHWWDIDDDGWLYDGEWDDFDGGTDGIDEPYPLDGNAIEVTFSNDGRTVTLTPNFGLSADDGTPVTPVSTKVAEDGIAVVLEGVRLRIVGSSECTYFDDIWVRDQFPVVPFLQISEVDEAP